MTSGWKVISRLRFFIHVKIAKWTVFSGKSFASGHSQTLSAGIEPYSLFQAKQAITHQNVISGRKVISRLRFFSTHTRENRKMNGFQWEKFCQRAQPYFICWNWALQPISSKLTIRHQNETSGWKVTGRLRFFICTHVKNPKWKVHWGQSFLCAQDQSPSSKITLYTLFRVS